MISPFVWWFLLVCFPANSPLQIRRIKLNVRPGSAAFLGQKFFGLGQPFAGDFQIIIAVAKFNQQFGERDEVFHLVA